jgi:RNA polymerase sigma factor (sigma-70 family)
LSQEILHAGSEEAEAAKHLLDAALRRCRDKWFRFVLQIVQNHADAEDALQEGFCRVLASRRVFQTEEQARMYLARTISNTAIEIYHHRVRDRRSRTPDYENQLPDKRYANPLVFLEKRESVAVRLRVMELLRQALGRLPVRQYEALKMTIMDPAGTSIRDAGEVQGIAYSTLRHRRVQGLRRLKKYISRALRKIPSKVVLA